MNSVFEEHFDRFEGKTVCITTITHTRFFVRDPEKRIVKACNVVLQEVSTLRVELHCCELGH